jgi:hypothetical protein
MTKKRTIALLVVPLFSLAVAHAEEARTSNFTEELAKQESIYRADGDKIVEGYTVDRTLKNYADGLASGFDNALAKLGPSDRWLDIGAGKAQAILDYYAPAYNGQEPRESKAQAVAMSIEDRKTPLWEQIATTLGGNQLRYLSGKRLGQYSAEELGRFQVISDVLGGFSYTDNLTRFMEKVLGVLDVNGTFFSVLQDVHFQDATNRPYYEGSPFLTEIVDADGSELRVCSWLKRISCVEVTCEARATWKPPLEAFRVRKVCENVSVPPLRTLRYEAGTPPERRFQVEAATTAQASSASASASSTR